MAEVKEKKRLTMDFDRSAYELLEELASKSGKTKAGVIRTALAVYAVAKEEEARKNKLAVVNATGHPVKQLIIT